MLTYQDFIAEPESKRPEFIRKLIDQHNNSELVKTARIADLYDQQRNVTINEYVQKLYTASGIAVENYVASNNKIASNFFRRLNTQRNTYLLGNGITFTGDENGQIKARMGEKFDTNMKRAGYYALIHGLVFIFWNATQTHVFPVTEFAPLWDERNSTLRAGVRYWRLDADKPLIVILYEEDGYTKYSTQGSGKELIEVEPKRAYKQTIAQAPADLEPVVIGEENYSNLPIVPLWGSSLHQSTLIGMRQAIDSYDLVRSGFANDLEDCAQIYWLLENYGGMNDTDLAQFRDRLRLQHIAVADTSDGGKVQGYTHEVPHQARQTYLDSLRAGIYEDFGGLDVHTVAAGATNDHIEAAYQPMDEQADDYEYQLIECIQQLLKLAGQAQVQPIFKRNRIANQREIVEMLMLSAEYLDEETIVSKLPFISPDEIQQILERRDAEMQSRLKRETAQREELMQAVPDTTEEDEGQGGEV
jgi:hypothetical protein